MERHREAQLRQALDEVWLVGSKAIRWDEFYLWTGVQRIAKKPWRDVYRIWEELCQEQGYDEALPLTVLSKDFAVIFRRDSFEEEKETSIEELV
ncbi:primase-like DNA-binding domain-containing protein [Cupriavidus campinensis]|uniref:primase-like DNA-binding domain-containing protein n=1 Tax=Cupriavidus campinensis TaxID=151783 RepID=UPI0011EEF32E|nr:primase-like DNA-binding domain-containing protein [Cupriavidus campinensis]